MKGKLLGSRYKVLEYIAKGGFGRTYLAEDTQLPGRDRCVVKQLYPSIEDSKFLAVARRLFKTEASTLYNLGNHDQIPKLLAYFEEEEKFYLVQQYIEGQTLAKELIPGQVWSEAQVIELLKDGLNILEFIHAKGVIHRDVKPDNLIRRNFDHKFVLVDFGTVKEVLKGQTNLGQLTVAVGTQGYMPTEQARGKPRPTSDLYALGIIGIQALTGVAPLDLEEDDEGELIWESLADISPQLAKILTKMTRYHFKDRYQSAGEALQALATLPESNVNKPQSVTAIYPSRSDFTESSSLTTVSDSSISANELLPTSLINSTTSQNVIGQSSPPEAISQATVPSAIAHNPQFTAKEINRVSSVNQQINSHKNVGKSKNMTIWGLAIALSGAIIGGTYLLTQEPIKTPSTPKKPPTERVDQGEGFRKEFFTR